MERIARGIQGNGTADDRAVRARVLDVINGFVPFDFYAFLLTDPTTTVGCSPVASVPDPSRLPELIRAKYLTPVNRWTGLPVVGCLSLLQATDGRPEQSLLWREHLAGLGVADVLSVVFSDRFGCWGFLDLWRLSGGYTHEESTALAGARSAITSLLRLLQATAFTDAGDAIGQRGAGALVLSAGLEVGAQTSQTRDWLAALVPPQSGLGPVPASAYNVAAQLLATEAGVDTHPAMARVHLGAGSWLTLRAARLGDDRTPTSGDIVVTMEASSPTERREVFSRAHGLSRREDELLGHLADGSDTRTLARVMSISELTVQDHLKLIFTKTSTASRRELIARAHGT